MNKGKLCCLAKVKIVHLCNDVFVQSSSFEKVDEVFVEGRLGRICWAFFLWEINKKDRLDMLACCSMAVCWLHFPWRLLVLPSHTVWDLQSAPQSGGSVGEKEAWVSSACSWSGRPWVGSIIASFSIWLRLIHILVSRESECTPTPGVTQSTYLGVSLCLHDKQQAIFC